MDRAKATTTHQIKVKTLTEADDKRSNYSSNLKASRYLTSIIIVACILAIVGVIIWAALDSNTSMPLPAIENLIKQQIDPPNNYTKLLVVAGSSMREFTLFGATFYYLVSVVESEVLELSDANKTCQSFLQEYPDELYGITGGLLNESTLLFCGGQSPFEEYLNTCYFLHSDGRVETTDLQSNKTYASSAILNDTIYVTGGYDGTNQTSSTEYVNRSATISGPNLLTPEHRHCLVKLNATTLLLLSQEKDTAFFDIPSQDWRFGPPMQFLGYVGEERDILRFGCSLIYFNGGSAVVASGRGPFLTYTEMLDLQPRNGLLRWTFGPTLPETLLDFKMVSYGNSVVAVGGSNSLYKLQCGMNVFRCHWEEMIQKTTEIRLGHEAIMIPDSMANCTTSN